MKTVTYTCDRCKREIGNKADERVLNLSIAVDYEPYVPSHGSGSKRRTQWCQLCAEHFGLVPAVRTPKEEIPETTLDDLIRAIVQEELEP